MKYSVVVVDDYTLLCEAIEGIVNSFENFEVLYTCKNGDEIEEKFLNSKNIPDIVLVSVNTGTISGIETTKRIVRNYPAVRVMTLSVKNLSSAVIKMLSSNAVSFLTKNTQKETLEKALLKLAQKKITLQNPQKELSVKPFLKKDYENRVKFKDNEVKFMQLACSELTYKEIAAKMFLSPKTIDGYRDSLFTKLNVKNRVGLVMYAIKNKIYTP